jgi:DNA-binding response OmpR family regulator
MNLNGHSVLVVEDDKDINMLVGAYVELCGYEYRSALNGTRALQEAHDRKPALVILDLMLPDFDGFEVCKRLKADDSTRNVPVVMLTAMCGEQNRQRGLQCGAAAYLTKPFEPDELMQTIAQHATPDEKQKKVER